MKTLLEFLIDKDTHVYNYFPENKRELKKIINKLIKERGKNADLNDIDISNPNIRGLEDLFSYSDFDGDISKWNVSNIKYMGYMFEGSKFTGKHGDISKWKVNNVVDFHNMFYDSKFNGDLSNWNVNKKADLSDMFFGTIVEKNPPKWYNERFK